MILGFAVTLVHCATASVLQPAGYNHVLGSMAMWIAVELRWQRTADGWTTEVQTPHWLKVIAGTRTKLTHLDVAWMLEHLPESHLKSSKDL